MGNAFGMGRALTEDEAVALATNNRYFNDLQRYQGYTREAAFNAVMKIVEDRESRGQTLSLHPSSTTQTRDESLKSN